MLIQLYGHFRPYRLYLCCCWSANKGYVGGGEAVRGQKVVMLGLAHWYSGSTSLIYEKTRPRGRFRMWGISEEESISNGSDPNLLPRQPDSRLISLLRNITSNGESYQCRTESSCIWTMQEWVQCPGPLKTCWRICDWTANLSHLCLTDRGEINMGSFWWHIWGMYTHVLGHVFLSF